MLEMTAASAFTVISPARLAEIASGPAAEEMATLQRLATSILLYRTAG